MDTVVAQECFSLLVLILEKTGVLTEFQAEAIRAETSLEQFISHLKTYPTYPVDKGGDFGEQKDGT